MKVLKFGGTSVGTVESLANVKRIVESLPEPAIVVVSALGGLTDRLIATAHMAADNNPDFHDEMRAIEERHRKIIEAVVPEQKRCDVFDAVYKLIRRLSDIYMGLSLIRILPPQTLDLVVSFGERISSIIVANMIEGATHHDSLAIVKTEKWQGKNIAERNLTACNIKEEFKLPLKEHAVMGGFISTDRDSNEITNLGRGGSDYTAALVAAALDADSLEIWTDVNGFMTADPRIIPSATVMPHMSFIESMELCTFGAKVIYPPTIYPVFHKNIPIKILNTFRPEMPGTLIDDAPCKDDAPVRGVSSIKDASLVVVSGSATSNVASINSRTFNAMVRAGVNIFLVAQPDAESAIMFALKEADAANALQALNEEFAPELATGEIDSIDVCHGMAIIAVVGENIKRHAGLGTRLVYTLQRNEIEVKAFSDGASETTITVVVDSQDTNKALQLIHEHCFG